MDELFNVMFGGLPRLLQPDGLPERVRYDTPIFVDTYPAEFQDLMLMVPCTIEAGLVVMGLTFKTAVPALRSLETYMATGDEEALRKVPMQTLTGGRRGHGLTGGAPTNKLDVARRVTWILTLLVLLSQVYLGVVVGLEKLDTRSSDEIRLVRSNTNNAIALCGNLPRYDRTLTKAANAEVEKLRLELVESFLPGVEVTSQNAWSLLDARLANTYTDEQYDAEYERQDKSVQQPLLRKIEGLKDMCEELWTSSDPVVLAARGRQATRSDWRKFPHDMSAVTDMFQALHDSLGLGVDKYVGLAATVVVKMFFTLLAACAITALLPMCMAEDGTAFDDAVNSLTPMVPKGSGGVYGFVMSCAATVWGVPKWIQMTLPILAASTKGGPTGHTNAVVATIQDINKIEGSDAMVVVQPPRGRNLIAEPVAPAAAGPVKRGRAASKAAMPTSKGARSRSRKGK